MIYIVQSFWNASTSRLHQKSFDSLEEACTAIGSDVVDDGWSDEYEGKPCNAVGVYASKADREANAEGAAPHLVLATVLAVRK